MWLPVPNSSISIQFSIPAAVPSCVITKLTVVTLWRSIYAYLGWAMSTITTPNNNSTDTDRDIARDTDTNLDAAT